LGAVGDGLSEDLEWKIESVMVVSSGLGMGFLFVAWASWACRTSSAVRLPALRRAASSSEVALPPQPWTSGRIGASFGSNGGRGRGDSMTVREDGFLKLVFLRLGYLRSERHFIQD
jgi:hypothetical protein